MSFAAASALLREAGIANPGRLPGLIRRTIAFLELNFWPWSS